MRKEVKEAIDRGIVLRSQVLSDLKYRQRVRLLELLFQDFFIDQHQLLQKWAALTGQTAQIDTGYIAQFSLQLSQVSLVRVLGGKVTILWMEAKLNLQPTSRV